MKKSQIVSGMNFGTEFLTCLYRQVLEIGGTEEQMFQKMKTGSTLIKKWARDIVSKPSLNYLTLIIDNIPIATQPFQSDSFFKNGPVKLQLSHNFMNWILKVIPDSIPAFEGILRQTQFSKNMYDFEILAELGHPKPFSLSEFTAILSYLLTKQLKGEEGTLFVNGFVNVFYVQLEHGRVVVVNAYWGRDEWSLGATGLGNDVWRGHCIFSRG